MTRARVALTRGVHPLLETAGGTGMLWQVAPGLYHRLVRRQFSQEL